MNQSNLGRQSRRNPAFWSFDSREEEIARQFRREAALARWRAMDGEEERKPLPEPSPPPKREPAPEPPQPCRDDDLPAAAPGGRYL